MSVQMQPEPVSWAPNKCSQDSPLTAFVQIDTQCKQEDLDRVVPEKQIL